MNVLDENVFQGQRELLQSWGIPIRQIGYEIGRRGTQDEEVLPLLRRSRRATSFTWDADFYKRGLCHAHYSLVYLDVGNHEFAVYVRRLLHHPAFNTEAKRMGAVGRVAAGGLTV